MIRLRALPLETVQQARDGLQTAIELEFSTLPVYLYAFFSIPEGRNPAAAQRIRSIQMQEMVHMCLACNILNALGGAPQMRVPTYPGPLPGDIGQDGERLIAHLYRFSEGAMQQGMDIERPVDPIEAQKLFEAARAGEPTETIGQFYERLRRFLQTLPPSDWYPDRRQLTDTQFLQGQIFAINSFVDADRAIQIIVSQGEGATDTPLDFQNELAHFYRFEEIFKNRVLTRDPKAKQGYVWGAPLGVKWEEVYPAIDDPSLHDFSQDSAAAQAAQTACNKAFSKMVDALQLAVTGQPDQLGVAVGFMFELRMAALAALQVPLADGKSVAGPAFIYSPAN
jgi:hypothetical protein